jgi:hypothetical protein
VVKPTSPTELFNTYKKAIKSKESYLIVEEKDKYDSYDLGIVPEDFDINNESHHKHIPFGFNKNSDYKYIYFPIEE